VITVQVDDIHEGLLLDAFANGEPEPKFVIIAFVIFGGLFGNNLFVSLPGANPLLNIVQPENIEFILVIFVIFVI
jgi:hypothetical protein